MKQFINKFKYFLLGGLVLIAGSVLAVQVSIPSAPSAGYGLVATSTGNWIATTTDPWHVGSLVATTSGATSLFNGNLTANGTLTLTGITGTQCLHSISGAVSGSGADCGSGTFPFTSVSGYNSTSTVIGFLNGLFSTASSTFSGNLFLSALSQGILYTGSSGQVNSVSTSTLSASSPLTGSFTQIGSGGSLGCQSASGSQAGCLSSVDWNIFNGKQNAGAYISNPFTNSFITNFLGSLYTSATTSALTINSVATTTIGNLGGTYWVPPDFAVNGCAGNASYTDLGKCVNGLYSLASTSGNYAVKIKVPNIKVTATQWSTAMNFNINGLGIQLECERGATLIWGGTGTSTIVNTGNPTGHYVSEISGCNFQGNSTLIAAGNANTKTTGGIALGGSNGGVGINFHDNNVNGFGMNLAWGGSNNGNAYMLNINHNSISGGNSAIFGNEIFIGLANNSGERNVISDNSITDPGGSVPTNCFYIQSGATASDFITHNAIDDCQIYVGSSNGTVDINENHFENAAFATYGAYIPIQGVSSDLSTIINFNGNTVANDTSGANSFDTILKVGGPVSSIGNSLQNYGGGTVSAWIDHSLDNGVSHDHVCQIQVQGGALTNIIAGSGGVAYSRATGGGCVDNTDNSYSIGMRAMSNNTNEFFSGGTTVGTFDHNGNWTFGVAAVPSTVTIQKNLTVGSSNVGVLTVSTTTAGCLSTNSSGVVWSSGAACGGGSSFTGAANSIVTTNASGNLIATGTQLTVGNLIATTSASSYFLGNVGIGTTSPSGMLDVKGQISLPYGNALQTDNMYTTNNTILTTTWTGSQDQTQLWVPGNSSGDGTAKIVVQSNGNVGIATTAPVALLSLGNGTGAAGTTAALGLNLGDPKANLYRSAAGFIQSDGSFQALNVKAKSANAEFDVINTNDSTTKNGFFKVTYDGLEFGYVDNATIMYVGKLFGSNTVVGTSNIVNVGALTDFNNLLDDGLGNALFLHKVGVATTTPVFPLVAYSTTQPQLALSAGGGSAQWTIRNAGANLYFATTTVNGTATSTTISPFEIRNSGAVYAPFTATNGSVQTGTWCWDTNGQFVRDTAVCAVSARKFKKDIKPLTVGLSDLVKMNFVSYLKKDPLNAEDSHLQMGVIADDVAKISPQLNEMLVTYVGGGTSGEVHAFRYDQFTALLGQSIKDLNQKVDDMQVGKVARSAEENWQWLVMGLLVLWNIWLTFRKQ